MPKRDKILFKMWKFPRLSETFILAQMITAIKCNYQVRILIDDFPDFEESTYKDLIKKYQIQNKILTEDYKIPKNRFLRFLKGILIIFLNLFYIKWLYNYLKNFKTPGLIHIYQFHFFKKFRSYQIVHVQYGTNSAPLDILKKINFFPPKLVVSFHGHDLYFPINGVIPNNGYYNNLFEYADLLVANTPYLKTLIVKLGGSSEKIKTIPVSVNTNFFKPGKESQEEEGVIKLITVGRLEIVKGQIYGLRVIEYLKQKGYSVKYTLVGDGSQFNNLRDCIKYLKLEKNVVMTGKKSQKEIKEILHQHDIFLMTSVKDPSFGEESQGLVTAEAQACGLPVIGFDSGGVKHSIKEGVSGYIVPEKDYKTMAVLVEELFNNPEKRKKLSLGAVNYIEMTLSQNHLNEVWCQTYKELIR